MEIGFQEENTHSAAAGSPPPPQRSIVSLQFSLIGTGGVGSMDGMVVVVMVVGGPEGSTEHYNQSMCVGLMINALSPPSLGGLGSSLYKGTSILLMFASKHLSLPPNPASVHPLWMPTSQNRTPGASEGSSHI